MKKLVLVFTCMFVVVSVFAQTNFQDLTLEKALEKAKAENKYVFVDCYTVWCGPCRMMSEKVLPLKEVGEYMNKKFVCIKVDMEKGEGLNMARKYQVSAYPTFLVLTADGNLLHRVVGASVTGEEFIKKIEAGFDENSASNLEKEYAAGNRDMNFLVRYIKALLVSCDWDKAKNVAQEVIASLSDEEKCEKVTKDAEVCIDRVIEKVVNRVRGDFDNRKIPHWLAFPYTYCNRKKSTAPFVVLGRCIRCGACAKKCPMGAIEMRDNRPIWIKEQCLQCLGCLHRCPVFAIQYGKKTIKHGQFVHPGVKM